MYKNAIILASLTEIVELQPPQLDQQKNFFYSCFLFFEPWLHVYFSTISIELAMKYKGSLGESIQKRVLRYCLLYLSKKKINKRKTEEIKKLLKKQIKQRAKKK